MDSFVKVVMMLRKIGMIVEYDDDDADDIEKCELLWTAW